MNAPTSSFRAGFALLKNPNVGKMFIAYLVSYTGTAMAPIAMLRGRHRMRFLVKAGRDIHIQAFLRAWLSQVKVPGKVRLSVDIDPYSFL